MYVPDEILDPIGPLILLIIVCVCLGARAEAATLGGVLVYWLVVIDFMHRI